MEELENMLQNIKGSYKDFVKGVLDIAKENNNLDKIKDYINNNDDITDEDILKYTYENCDYTTNNDDIPEWAQDDED